MKTEQHFDSPGPFIYRKPDNNDPLNLKWVLQVCLYKTISDWSKFWLKLLCPYPIVVLDIVQLMNDKHNINVGMKAEHGLTY